MVWAAGNSGPPGAALPRPQDLTEPGPQAQGASPVVLMPFLKGLVTPNSGGVSGPAPC